MGAKQTDWTTVWGNAVSINENRPESYGKNITLCYKIFVPFDAEALRLTFDNYCGTEPVTVTRVAVLVGDRLLPLTFQGKEHAVIPAGERILSDAVSVAVSAKETVEARIFLGEITQLRSAVFVSGPLSDQNSYAVGDFTQDIVVSKDLSRKTNMIYFLSNVEVLTNQPKKTIVCYGDSITAQAWPDYLSLRCANEHPDTAIVRRATSGSRVLREYSCITYESYGLMGKKRFLHEVPTTGAKAVILQQGINDIIHPVGIEVNPFRPMSDYPTREELIEGLTYYILCARDLGYRVYLGTLLPIEGWRTYEPFRDELRNAVNDWMRTTTLADGCIDFDKALRDPERPARFLPEYDSGDHLHPSAAGYKRMAEEIPGNLLDM